jgi:site-specific recombinase XerD
MATAFAPTTWEEALREFLLHLTASSATKTVRYYRVQVTNLSTWAETNQISFESFGKRHLDRYLAHRIELGKKPLTLRHDAVCTKKFINWCSKNDLLERNLLADYQVRNAPYPARYMPSDEDVRTLLTASRTIWDPERNPGCRFQSARKRSFHRDRNHAVLLGLLDTACRIGEMLNLKVSDFREGDRQILVRESKGKEPRALPVSAEWAEAVGIWLKVRVRVMAGAQEDEGWLFVSQTGSRLDECRFLKTLRQITEFAGLTDQITLHSLRRYSINKLAKYNLLAAQQIAGHKETKTTLLYTKLDPTFVRDMHEQVGVLRDIMGTRREEGRGGSRRKRLV